MSTDQISDFDTLEDVSPSDGSGPASDLADKNKDIEDSQDVRRHDQVNHGQMQ
ncbi:MAG: hypothetical protein OXE59_10755 [Bacteroidetes bacterium]|nr:hypothetical protein [Bacteroidota bacterium]